MRPLAIFLTTLTAFLLAGLAPAQQDLPPALSQIIQRDFAADPLWDDGKAEVATYRSSMIVYNKQRPHTSHLITVKETFNKNTYTKADWPYGQKPLLPVIKQNYVAVVPTPNYDYHFNSSLFVERENFGRAVKLSFVAFEWCGNTSKEFQLWRPEPRQLFMSYWDGEGTGERPVDGSPDVYFEEELPLVLRGLPFEDGLEARLELYDNQISNKAPTPQKSAARLVVKKENADDPAWLATVETQDGRIIRYRFEPEYPHVMLEMNHSDGRSMRLETVERNAYWIAKE